MSIFCNRPKWSVFGCAFNSPASFASLEKWFGLNFDKKCSILLYYHFKQLVHALYKKPKITAKKSLIELAKPT